MNRAQASYTGEAGPVLGKITRLGAASRRKRKENKCIGGFGDFFFPTASDETFVNPRLNG